MLQIYLKIMISVKMRNLGAISLKFDILSITAIEVRKLKILWHMYDIYNCNYLRHSTFSFNLIDFQLNTDFPSQICVFSVKSHSLTQRSVSQENAYKKS